MRRGEMLSPRHEERFLVCMAMRDVVKGVGGPIYMGVREFHDEHPGERFSMKEIVERSGAAKRVETGPTVPARVTAIATQATIDSGLIYKKARRHRPGAPAQMLWCSLLPYEKPDVKSAKLLSFKKRAKQHA